MMHRYLSHDRMRRNDSAMDLPSSTERHVNSGGLHDRSLVPLPTAESNYPPPWSAFNTRCEADRIIANETWDTTVTTSDVSQPILPTGYDDDYYIYGNYMDHTSGPDYPPPGSESPTDCSIAPTPQNIQLWTSSSMATPSNIRLQSANGDSGPISCTQCDVLFTGAYCKGSLGRHVLLKHPKGKRIQYECPAKTCLKVFQRSDARLNHVRKEHPALVQLLGHGKKASIRQPDPKQGHTFLQQLQRYCATHQIAQPQFQDYSDPRGKRTAWCSSVFVLGREYRAHLWRDFRYLEQSHEEAAEVAWKALSGGTTNSRVEPYDATNIAVHNVVALDTPPVGEGHDFEHMFSWWQQEHDGNNLHGGIAPDLKESFACRINNQPSPPCLINPQCTGTSSIAFSSPPTNIGKSDVPQQGTVDLVELVMAKLKFDPAAYGRTWVAFITRWSYILQELLDQGSDAYPIFAQIINEIRAAFLAANERSRDQCQSRAKASHGKRPSSSGKSKQPLSLNSSLTSPTSRIGKHSGRSKPQENALGSKLMITAEDNIVDSVVSVVDCPVFKHHLMHETVSPCRGCRATAMAHVRGHLNPVRTSTHRTENGLFPGFLAQCSRCKVNFIDSEIFNAHTTPSISCDFVPQMRGDILIPWIQLYLGLYPNSLRVPEPWHERSGWLPDALVDTCRPLPSNTLSAVNFLGPAPGEAQVPVPSPQIAPEGPSSSAYNAMRNFVLADLAEPMYIQTSSLLPPVPNPNRQRQFNVNISSPHPSSISSDHAITFNDIVMNLNNLQSNLSSSATHFSPNQLQYVTEWCHQMHHIHRGLQTGSSLQSPAHITLRQENRNSIGTQHIMSAMPSIPISAPVLGLPPSQTPSSSTQASSWYNLTRSSQQPSSAFTNASSFQMGPEGQQLDMDSPPLRRTMSRSSEQTPERSRLRPTRPSRISLPDQSDHSPYLVPSAVQTPDEDFISLPLRTRQYSDQ